MKVSLNFPDGPQLDLVKLGSELEAPLEKVIVAALAVGTRVIATNPKLKEQIKQQLKSGKNPPNHHETENTNTVRL